MSKLLLFFMPFISMGLTVYTTGFDITDAEVSAPIDSALGYGASAFRFLLQVMGNGMVAGILIFAIILFIINLMFKRH